MCVKYTQLVRATKCSLQLVAVKNAAVLLVRANAAFYSKSPVGVFFVLGIF